MSTHGYDLATRWYVCYIETIAGKRTFKKKYGNINQFNNVEQRLAAAQALLERLRIETTEVLVTPPLVQDILIVLERVSLNMRHKSISTYRTKVLHFARWLVANNINDWKQITLKLVYEYFDNIDKAHATTHNSYMITAKTFLAYCFKFGYLKQKLTFDYAKRPQNKTSQKHFRSNEIALLKQILQTHLMQWMAAQLLYYCFIRPGEMRELRVEQFDIDLGIISIPGSISKNKKTQSVVIPNQFVPAVQAWLQGLPQSHYFINQSPTPLSRDAISKQHRVLLQGAGFGKGYSFYSWKHTGAIHAARGGINLKDLQMQLRHHSLDMVNEYLKQLGVIDSVALRTQFPTL